MQLMSWMVARMGSRFSLLFEPHHRRVRHSALGRYFDRPMDLMVGLVEPDGSERVLPFTTRGQTLFCCEQFERINSITFRGYSEHYRLRFEFNIHSVFYPQDEALCTIPAFYLEMRISGAGAVQWIEPKGPTPESVNLFIRLNRSDTRISTAMRNDQAGIDLTYPNSLTPHFEAGAPPAALPATDQRVTVHERIVSINPGCRVDDDGMGMSLDLPVTEVGSGIKWRLVWAAHCSEPVLQLGDDAAPRYARFRYVNRLADIDAVVHDALTHRDDRLVHSRRFERLFDQAPLRMAQRHMVNQSFQCFLGNTFWCDLTQSPDQSSQTPPDTGGPDGQWFSVLDGRRLAHSTVDVEYNTALFYLALWPELLAQQFRQWTQSCRDHPPSQGCYLAHDLGQGYRLIGPARGHDMPVEENSNYLLLMQAYAHWTGDLSIAQEQAGLLQRLVDYLIWCDREQCGFATEGTVNTIDDAGPALRCARRQTYLSVKRLAAISAAGDLLARLGRTELAHQCDRIVQCDAQKIDQLAWAGDHYVVCCDPSTTGLVDVATGEPFPYEKLPGTDAYSIYTANGLLLPAMIGRPWLLDEKRLQLDLTNATRETLDHYGCGHSSHERENVRISQNLWRDLLACYLNLSRPLLAQRYWDLQVMSNTADQSSGFIDTYVTNDLRFHPRGVVSLGFFLAQVRLIIDRLSPGGQRISIDPDRHTPQRWPLLPLADWKAGKIPVCVVDERGQVTIEGEADPVIVHGAGAPTNEMIG